MKRDFWKAVKLLLAKLLDLNINEKLLLENQYLFRENKSWGYVRITGALENLGFDICPSTVANIMKRNGLNLSDDRTKEGMSWLEFIRLHREVL